MATNFGVPINILKEAYMPAYEGISLNNINFIYFFIDLLIWVVVWLLVWRFVKSLSDRFILKLKYSITIIIVLFVATVLLLNSIYSKKNAYPPGPPKLVDQFLVVVKQGQFQPNEPEQIAQFVNGRVDSCVENFMCLIKVSSKNEEELNAIMDKVKSNSNFNNITVGHNITFQ
jgi:hypothetical protein